MRRYGHGHGFIRSFLRVNSDSMAHIVKLRGDEVTLKWETLLASVSSSGASSRQLTQDHPGPPNRLRQQAVRIYRFPIKY